MSNNIYLGNLPGWVTADDIRSWLDSSDLVCDSIRVIRDFETQESKGYAFVEAPNEEEMEAIIRRFNRAPIDGKLLRAKTAHPKGEKPGVVRSSTGSSPLKRRKRRRDGDGDGDGDGAPSENAERQSAKAETVGTLGEALQKAL
jgi:RNA recognition motif-containing protein